MNDTGLHIGHFSVDPVHFSLTASRWMMTAKTQGAAVWFLLDAVRARLLEDAAAAAGVTAVPLTGPERAALWNGRGPAWARRGSWVVVGLPTGIRAAGRLRPEQTLTVLASHGVTVVCTAWWHDRALWPHFAADHGWFWVGDRPQPLQATVHDRPPGLAGIGTGASVRRMVADGRVTRPDYR
jgi:hypothetical protein